MRTHGNDFRAAIGLQLRERFLPFDRHGLLNGVVRVFGAERERINELAAVVVERARLTDLHVERPTSVSHTIDFHFQRDGPVGIAHTLERHLHVALVLHLQTLGLKAAGFSHRGKGHKAHRQHHRHEY